MKWDKAAAPSPTAVIQHELNDGRRTHVWVKRKVSNLDREEGCQQGFSSL
jgi:hypothetical protein